MFLIVGLKHYYPTNRLWDFSLTLEIKSSISIRQIFPCSSTSIYEVRDYEMQTTDGLNNRLRIWILAIKLHLWDYRCVKTSLNTPVCLSYCRNLTLTFFINCFKKSVITHCPVPSNLDLCRQTVAASEKLIYYWVDDLVKILGGEGEHKDVSDCSTKTQKFLLMTSITYQWFIATVLTLITKSESCIITLCNVAD